MGAGRGAGRNRGAPERAVLQDDIDFDGRIAAAVENFTGNDIDDGGHGASLGGGKVAVLLADNGAAGKPPEGVVTVLSQLSINKAKET